MDGSDRDPKVASLVPIVAAVDVHARFALAKPARFGLLAMGLAEQRDLVADGGSDAVWQGVDRVINETTRMLSEACTAGALPPYSGPWRDRSVLLVMGSQGMLQLAKMARHVPDVPATDHMAASLCDALLVAWGASSVDVCAARAIATR